MPGWIFNECNCGLLAGHRFVKQNSAQVWNEAANSPLFSFVLSSQISGASFGCRASNLISSKLPFPPPATASESRFRMFSLNDFTLYYISFILWAGKSAIYLPNLKRNHLK